MKYILILILAACPGGAAASSDLVQAAEHPDLQSGLSHLYNLDYENARSHAESFLKSHPDNPLARLFLSGALWCLFTTESGQNRPHSGLRESFEEQVDATVAASEPLILDKNPSRRSDGLFAAGMALGLRGQMKLANGDFLEAYRDGKKAIKLLNRCVEINPDYHDAYLGLGIFDYQVAVLPGVLKFGAKLLFRGTGDAPRGLRRIRTAIDRGRFANRQASAFLLTIMTVNERDYAAALALAKSLRKDFPKSPYYWFLESALLHRTGHPEESKQLAKGLFEHLKTEPELFARKQLATLCGQFGPNCLERSHLAGAEKWISAALAESPNEDWAGILSLYRAFARDLLGRRTEALSDFSRVLALPEIAASHDWARACSRKACSEERVYSFLRGEPAG